MIWVRDAIFNVIDRAVAWWLARDARRWDDVHNDYWRP